MQETFSSGVLRLQPRFRASVFVYREAKSQTRSFLFVLLLRDLVREADLTDECDDPAPLSCFFISQLGYKAP